MKKILFIGNYNRYNIKFSLDLLKKNNEYDIELLSNIEKIYEKKDMYALIIIDIEFNNRKGDLICKNIRYKYRKIPIVGIYANYDSQSRLNKFDLTKFNNIVSLPVLNWKEVFDECYLPCMWSKKKWEEWVFKEKTLSSNYRKNAYI